jgi:hypothetical protein
MFDMGGMEVVDRMGFLAKVANRFTQMPRLHEGSVVRAIVESEYSYGFCHEKVGRNSEGLAHQG